jgi:hypothetical protein
MVKAVDDRFGAVIRRSRRTATEDGRSTAGCNTFVKDYLDFVGIALFLEC